MDELLHKIDDPDVIKTIQGKWNELVAANDNYERNYPQQYANLVEGNLKFKEQKSIPTPAEQLQMYESMVIAEIKDYLDEKQKEEKEATYELEQGDNTGKNTPDDRERFRLSYADITKKAMQPGTPQKSAPSNNIEKSQELGVTWMKAYKEQREQEHKSLSNDKAVHPGGYELNLNFGKLEDLDKADRHMEPEAPEPEKD